MLNRVEFKTPKHQNLYGQYILPGTFTGNYLKFKILSRADKLET